MKEIIPSKDVRKYRQELMKRTGEVVLVQQIRERIAWDEDCINRIQNMTGNIVYHLKVWEQEDG